MEPITRSEDVGELTQALARAQRQMKNPLCDSVLKTDRYASKYPSLAAVRDAVLPPLTAEGIAVTQLLTTDAEGVTCATVLWLGNQWLSNSLWLPATVVSHQGYGSAITYCKRYALMALLCVAGDEEEPEPAPPVVRDAVDAYTADGLRERITALLDDRQVHPDRQALWWQEQWERHGSPVPLPILRQLYRRLRDEARKRPQQAAGGPPPPALTPESSPASRPPQPPAGGLASAAREGAAWDTLKAHRSDPRLPEALRHQVQLVVAGSVPLSDQDANRLAGEVLDFLDGLEE